MSAEGNYRIQGSVRCNQPIGLHRRCAEIDRLVWEGEQLIRKSLRELKNPHRLLRLSLSLRFIGASAFRSKVKPWPKQVGFCCSSDRAPRHASTTREHSVLFCPSWAFTKEQAIRTTVDIPVSLYRKLKAQAAAQGRSIRELILLGVRVTLVEGKRPRSRRVKVPLIVSEGPKVDLNNEPIYEHLEFP
jgi:hypothetical protein